MRKCTRAHRAFLDERERQQQTSAAKSELPTNFSLFEKLFNPHWNPHVATLLLSLSLDVVQAGWCQ